MCIRDSLDSLHFYQMPKRRKGAEKSRTLGETREERKEKREERDNHNPDERAAEGNSSVPEWYRKRREEEKAERIERNSEQLHCNRTATGCALSRDRIHIGL